MHRHWQKTLDVSGEKGDYASSRTVALSSMPILKLVQEAAEIRYVSHLVSESESAFDRARQAEKLASAAAERLEEAMEVDNEERGRLTNVKELLWVDKYAPKMFTDLLSPHVSENSSFFL